MTNPSAIEKVVMRRVRTIAILRPFVSGAAFATLLALLALWGIGREVWVAKVFANGPRDFVGHAFYLLYAFEHTRAVVQALSLVVLAAVIYLARETARVLAELVAPAFA
jgi:hypothetical protein